MGTETAHLKQRPQFRRLLFDNARKKIRENPCESVAEVMA